MVDQASDTIATLLEDAVSGEIGALDRLLPVVYDELRAMAHALLVRERRAHTLNTTALVHEAYLKLIGQEEVTEEGRAYFFGAAARAMRQVLVDFARWRKSKKRGGNRERVTLQEGRLAVDVFSEEMLDLDDALGRLASFDERASRVVECRFFGGLSVKETAGALDVSATTVKTDWAAARAWLNRELRSAKESS